MRRWDGETVVKRIAFVAPFGLGQKTTVWARSLPLAKELVRHGHVVTIVIPPWDTPADSGRIWDEDGVTLRNVRLGGGLPIVLGRMVAALRHFAPDIVHIVKPRAHAGLIQWLLWQQRKFSGTGPRLYLDVDDWEQAWAPINRYPPAVARFLAWQEEWGIRHADGITAASHWLVDHVRQYAPATPVLYLPNGLTAITLPTTNRATNGPRNTAHTSPQILFYSRYVEVAPEWLADFWSALYTLEPTATLVVFGDALEAGRPPQFKTAMQQHNAAAAHVIWQSYDPAVADNLFQASHCAIFPAAKTALHEAKCSVRLATTLLQGVPVVASAVGEQQYYGADGAAELVPATATPAEFAVVVEQVLRNITARVEQQMQARTQLLDRYSWFALGEQLARFY